jgi:hypothetical protein
LERQPNPLGIEKGFIMKVQTNLKAGSSGKADAAICSGICAGELQDKYTEGYIQGISYCS